MADNDIPKAANWLRYWKVSLADRDIGRGTFASHEIRRLQALSLPWSAVEGQAVQPSPDDGDAQSISPEVIEDWFQQQESMLLRDSAGAPWIQCIVAPYVYVIRHRHERGQRRQQYTPEMIAPVSFTVRVYRNGMMFPEGRPGIARELLEPSNGARPFSVGAVETLDRWFDNNPFPEWEDPVTSRWTLAQLIEYCDRLFESVIETDLAHPMGAEGPAYTLSRHPLIYRGRQDDGVIRPLLNNFDAAIERGELTRVGQRLRGFEQSSKRPPGLVHSMGSRLGSLKGTPLSMDQKQCVGSALMIGDGEVQAINGPPGTGKTTVIEDIVASAVVKAALQQKPAPMLALSSTNNQAVTNVLDTVARQCEALPDRWIQGWDAFGVYLPARSRAEQAQAQGYTTVEDMMTFERRCNLAEIEHTFIHRSNAYFDTHDATLAQCQARIHAKLKARANFIYRLRQLPSVVRGCRNKADVDKAIELIKQIHTVVHSTPGVRSGEGAWRELKRWIKEAQRIVARETSVKIERDRIREAHRLLLKQVPPFLVKASQNNALMRSLLIKWCRRNSIDYTDLGWDTVIYERLPNGHSQQTHAALQRLGQSLRWQQILPALDNLADRGLRRDAFALALHYYEACWIERMAGVGEREIKGRTAKPVMESMARRACLSPLIVGTFYTLPRYLSFWDVQLRQEVPLFETLDMLVVDEAGQASTEVAMGLIQSANRLVVIGDRHQVRPIKQVPRSIDIANMVATGVVPAKRDSLALEREMEPLEAWAKVAHRGSVLELCQPVSTFHTHPSVGRGAYLTLHRRCRKAIIGFSNKLVYEGGLSPIRREQPWMEALDPVAVLNVPGHCQRHHGSRYNDAEAFALAGQIARNQQAWKTIYPTNVLNEIVAVVTPFLQQANRVRHYLGEFGLAGEDITVGTIHSLQGAERPIIMLSLTYSATELCEHFHDRQPEILNVAVSRARDQLIVAGDLDALRFGERPSQVLLKHLAHQAKDHRIEHWETLMGHCGLIGGQRQGLTSQMHVDQWLSGLWQSSEWRNLVIVSPVLGLNSAEFHLRGMAQAVERGVSISIITGADQMRHEAYSHAFQRIRESLNNIGVSVQTQDHLHHSIVAADNGVHALFDGWVLGNNPADRGWPVAGVNCHGVCGDQALPESLGSRIQLLCNPVEQMDKSWVTPTHSAIEA